MSAEPATIFAVSTGLPPAAIGVIRISGPKAGDALRALAGRDFEPRRASLVQLRDAAGAVLDEALVLWFPGPRSATGEDCAELHCHGGRAVLAAVSSALTAIEGLQPAEEGEFTRRAFVNGRIDLAEAEGLADLLEAETELQRAAAMTNVSGLLSGTVEGWRSTLLALSAQIESLIDFSDEDDVAETPEGFDGQLINLAQEIGQFLDRPRSDVLKQGFRVALAGPPNSGKSTLFNALVEKDAAITSPIAGTTRDVIERAVAISGVPFSFVDTAGLRGEGVESIEALGIERAHAEFEIADVVLWLGGQGEGPQGAWEVAPKSDVDEFRAKSGTAWAVSAVTGEGVDLLKRALIDAAGKTIPKPGEVALNQRQHMRLSEAYAALLGAQRQGDLLLVGEELRAARLGFDRLIGRATTEDMLDALFGRFCIGK